jgi:hypothetical protein
MKDVATVRQKIKENKAIGLFCSSLNATLRFIVGATVWYSRAMRGWVLFCCYGRNVGVANPPASDTRRLCGEWCEEMFFFYELGWTMLTTQSCVTQCVLVLNCSVLGTRSYIFSYADHEYSTRLYKSRAISSHFVFVSSLIFQNTTALFDSIIAAPTFARLTIYRSTLKRTLFSVTKLKRPTSDDF